MKLPAPLVFWLPAPPDNANRKLHPMEAHKQNKRYLCQLSERCALGYGFPDTPPRPLARAVARATYYHLDRRYELDDDNATRRLKPVWDFLCRARYIAGDDPARLRIERPEQRFRDHTVRVPDLCTVRVELTPIP